jgi:hypothetical protein
MLFGVPYGLVDKELEQGFHKFIIFIQLLVPPRVHSSGSVFLECHPKHRRPVSHLSIDGRPKDGGRSIPACIGSSLSNSVLVAGFPFYSASVLSSGLAGLIPGETEL